MRRLMPALTMSVVTHAAFMIALVALVAPIRLDPATMRIAKAALSVVLVAPSKDASVAVTVPAMPAAVTRADPRTAPPAVPAIVPRPPQPFQLAVETLPAPDAAPPVESRGSADAHVEFATTHVLAQLGEALQTRSLFEFPPEVEVSVRQQGPIEVAYPPAALEERREATVIAWVIVDAEGQVEEISIPVGGPEFGEPVQNALLGAKFLPAEDGGKPIRYFTMLEFKFRVGAPDAPAPTPTATP